MKGKNRFRFEDALVTQMHYALDPVGDFKIRKESGRIFAEALGEYDFEEATAALSCVFGISGICPIVVGEDNDLDSITDILLNYMAERYHDFHFTFKVMVRRADKSFPMTSMELAAFLGEKLLERFGDLKVDVHDPDVYVTVEIRDKIYIYSEELPGPGGMPIGTNGKGHALLSGGIDSPVAGYMIAKRGVSIDAVYFHAPPYTSERAKQKVVDLARLISPVCRPHHIFTCG